MYVSGKRHGIFKAYTGGKLTEYGKCQDNKRVGVWYAISVNTDKLYETTYGDNGRISSKTYDDPEAITKIIKRLKNM